MTKKTNLRKPGETADQSAQWEIVGPQGGDQGGIERTVPKGTTLPPTPKPGQRYKPVDKTKTTGRKTNR